MFRLAIPVITLMAVSSCATLVTHETAVDSLRNSRSCCESFAQFKYDQMAESGDTTFNLDASSDAFEFQTGKSYFKAFRLPGKELPYRLKIQSYALGDQIDKAHIFYPQAALLDDRFDIISQSSPADFFLGKAGLEKTAFKTWGLPVRLEGYLAVNDPSARYLLIFTTSELMKVASPYNVQRTAPVILPGMVTALPTRQELIAIRHSPFGLLNLEIAGAEAGK